MARKRPAPYVPLSVYYADDEAIMEAGEDAELMYVRMLAYAGRTPNTEGYVSKRVCLTRLGIAARSPEDVPETGPEARLQRLVDVGLVVVDQDGYRIKSWLRWNRSIEEMGREREEDRRRKPSLTRHSPEDVPETGPEDVPETLRSPERFQRADTEADTEATTTCTTEVVPGAENTTTRGITPHDLAARRRRFEEFWATIPKRGKHSNPKDPARRKWDALVRTVDPERVIASARVWAGTREGEDPRLTPQAVTWLNQKRWADDEPATEPQTQRAEPLQPFAPPEPPRGMPDELWGEWCRTHQAAHRVGQAGPADWRALPSARDYPGGEQS